MSEPRGKSKHMTSVLGMSKLDGVAGPWRQHEEEEGREMSLGTNGPDQGRSYKPCEGV